MKKYFVVEFWEGRAVEREDLRESFFESFKNGDFIEEFLFESFSLKEFMGVVTGSFPVDERGEKFLEFPLFAGLINSDFKDSSLSYFRLLNLVILIITSLETVFGLDKLI